MWGYRRQSRGCVIEAALTPHTSTDVEQTDYCADMDEMRCMLYLHGGGYYFGSIDQERYMMQRFGRKMSGRIFGP
jgi:acetyl esterase/lipase